MTSGEIILRHVCGAVFFLNVEIDLLSYFLTKILSKEGFEGVITQIIKSTFWSSP